MKHFCVISHTHWDREWYMSLENFKFKLVDLIDRCISTIENNPDYIFHLDAQTIILEDYLEIRPNMRNKLKTLVTQKKLIIGPWYLQSDFYLTSGEATIRNLLEGKKIATMFGGSGKSGYAPDQFGNISQLPQILNGFGIDSFVFGRGLSQYFINQKGDIEKKSIFSENIWEGPDGSNVLAVYLPFWYNNAQRFSANLEKAKLLIDVNESLFENVASTPYILLMNGVDHLEAQFDLLPILANLNDKLQGNKIVYQCRLDDYINSVKSYVEINKIILNKLQGELRYGLDEEILKGTMSSRIYLKQSNVLAQNILENQLEPLYCILEEFGAKNIYSIDHFQYMWRELMKNHPHDSICGCSCDEVHTQMQERFRSIFRMLKDMTIRGLQIAADHIEVNLNCEDYILIVVNTLEVQRNGVVKAVIEILEEDNFLGFNIYDLQNNYIDFTVTSKKLIKKDIFSPVNLPGVIDVYRYEIYIYAQNINAMAIKQYIIRKIQVANIVIDNHIIKNNKKVIMENEFLIVNINEVGEIDLFDKIAKKKYFNIIDIEDCCDIGDSYNSILLNETHAYIYKNIEEIAVIENNDYVKCCKIRNSINLPQEYNYEEKKRSTINKNFAIELKLTLKKGSNILEIEYEFENNICDHRIRLLVNTNINTDKIYTDIPFDIISHKTNQHCINTMTKTLPNQSFALLEDENIGVAVFTKGTHECEHINEKNTVAITLVRCTELIYRTRSTQQSIGGTQWTVKENQCLTTIKGKLGIMPFIGTHHNAKVPMYSKIFRNDLLSHFTPFEKTKFSGGRTAVQDSKLSELFYLPDQYEECKIKDNISAIEIKGDGIIVSALKKAENNSGIVLRLFNYFNTTQVAFLKVSGNIYLVEMDESKEVFIGRNHIQIELTKKKIVTLLIKKL